MARTEAGIIQLRPEWEDKAAVIAFLLLRFGI